MAKSFKINSILAGWMSVSINGCRLFYDFSYMDLVKEELDRLFNLEEEEARHYVFDVESYGELLFQTYRRFDYIYITILNMEEGDNQCFKIKYKKFVKDYVQQMEKNKDRYLREFSYHEPTDWDNWNYSRLLLIVHNK